MIITLIKLLTLLVSWMMAVSGNDHDYRRKPYLGANDGKKRRADEEADESKRKNQPHYAPVNRNRQGNHILCSFIRQMGMTVANDKQINQSKLQVASY